MSSAQFLVVGTCVRAVPDSRNRNVKVFPFYFLFNERKIFLDRDDRFCLRLAVETYTDLRYMIPRIFSPRCKLFRRVKRVKIFLSALIFLLFRVCRMKQRNSLTLSTERYICLEFLIHFQERIIDVSSTRANSVKNVYTRETIKFTYASLPRRQTELFVAETVVSCQRMYADKRGKRDER